MYHNFSGGAYMPMDVSYPVPLLDDILSDAKPAAILADGDLVQFIPSKLFKLNPYFC